MLQGCLQSHLSSTIAEFLASILRLATEFLFYAHNLVILGQALRAAGCASFDLTGRETDDQIGNECVFSLSGTMGDHGAPTIAFGKFVGIDGFCHGSDLVDLQQQAVASLLFDGFLDSGLYRDCKDWLALIEIKIQMIRRRLRILPFWIGDKEVVTDDLNVSRRSKASPRIPVVLIERIFDRYD